jgi:RsiW-degrading membrane proteinase PrsW (M82 family)
MLIAISVASAISPPLFLLWFFHSRDRNAEPARAVWITFLLGVLTPIPVVVFAIPAMLAAGVVSDPLVSGALTAFLVAAVPEEFFKFLVLWFYAARHHAFDEPIDGMVYGAVASLGFATAENVLYVLQGGLGVALLRALTAVPMHAGLGAIMGYHVGQALFDLPRRREHLIKALAYPILLHALYDFPLLSLLAMAQHGWLDAPTPATILLGLGLVTLAIAALAIELAWTLVVVTRLRRDQHAAILSAQAALVASSAGGVVPVTIEPPPPA